MDSRDQVLLSTLTLKVRLLSLGQAARTWWEGDARQAARRTESLAEAGWLKRDAVTAHPELALEAPLLLWEPGDRVPHFGSLAYRAAERFQDRSEQMVVLRATRKAAELFGGEPGVLKAPSVTHDVQLAALYLRFLRDRPADAVNWLSEAALAPSREGEVLPDAAVTDDAGDICRVIEFVGRYPPERLRRLHEDCDSRKLPYELW